MKYLLLFLLLASFADISAQQHNAGYQYQAPADPMVREKLAQLVGCETGELIITRNTTESMDTVICGIDWKAGEEAVMAEQDYGAMLDMFKQQAK